MLPQADSLPLFTPQQLAKLLSDSHLNRLSDGADEFAGRGGNGRGEARFRPTKHTLGYHARHGFYDASGDEDRPTFHPGLSSSYHAISRVLGVEDGARRGGREERGAAGGSGDLFGPFHAAHYGTKLGHFETSKIHFPTSEGVSKVSERANE